MEPKDFEIMDRVGYDIAWCPGCGNFAIREVVKSALSELGLSPREVVMVSGIGQAAKMPHLGDRAGGEDAPIHPGELLQRAPR
jgi:2-oxoglutarate ferredoxin oxidoreductase subunit beta